jgi:hypothetical protein
MQAVCHNHCQDNAIGPYGIIFTTVCIQYFRVFPSFLRVISSDNIVPVVEKPRTAMHSLHDVYK